MHVLILVAALMSISALSLTLWWWFICTVAVCR